MLRLHHSSMFSPNGASNEIICWAWWNCTTQLWTGVLGKQLHARYSSVSIQTQLTRNVQDQWLIIYPLGWGLLATTILSDQRADGWLLGRPALILRGPPPFTLTFLFLKHGSTYPVSPWWTLSTIILLRIFSWAPLEMAPMRTKINVSKH